MRRMRGKFGVHFKPVVAGSAVNEGEKRLIALARTEQIREGDEHGF